MKPGIQRETFLRAKSIGSIRADTLENKIPAMSRNGAGNSNQFMIVQKPVAIGLLTCAGDARMKPGGIWNRAGVDDMNGRRIHDRRRCQNMRNGVQNPKGLVNRDLENGGCGINRTIDGSNTPRIPSPADAIGALAAVPGGCKRNGIETPDDQFGSAQQRWQRRHAYTP